MMEFVLLLSMWLMVNGMSFVIPEPHAVRSGNLPFAAIAVQGRILTADPIRWKRDDFVTIPLSLFYYIVFLGFYDIVSGLQYSGLHGDTLHGTTPSLHFEPLYWITEIHPHQCLD